MTERSIGVRLSLNVTDFIQGAQGAAKSLDQISRAGGNSERVASTAMGRFEQSARLQSAEWHTVGSHLKGVGTMLGAVGAAIAYTGGQYNVLQQSSRAALSTMLGGAAAANEQMDKLDEWATSSPFSRAVWIEAQQQLIAFGVEANRVIPYMDGIQNAVAAAGGSETHLRGITEIIAKIASAAKITGQDLMQFGHWGIDAASLIGAAMGKTGGQIREEITAGTLGASQALDALAEGMQRSFGGAAAGLKSTFTGAFDRVKAAFRDISAELMQPLIGKQGGGIFTDVLNGAADLLRAFQKLPTPVKDFTGAMGLAATGATLGAGAFMTFVPKALELQRALQSLAGSGLPVVSKMAERLTSVWPKLGEATVSLSTGFGELRNAFQVSSVEGISRMDALQVGVSQAAVGIGKAARQAGGALVNAFGGLKFLGLSAAVAGITALFAHFARQTQEAKVKAEAFADTLDEVTGAATKASRELVLKDLIDDSTSLKALESVGFSIRDIGDAVEKLDPAPLIAMKRELLDKKLEQYRQGASGFTMPWDVSVRAEGALNRVINQMETGAEKAGALRKGMTSAFEDTTAAVQTTAGAVGDYLGALRAVTDYQNASADSVLAAREAQRSFQDTLLATNEVLVANGAGLDINTTAGRENQAALDASVSSAKTFITSILSARDANGEMYYSLKEVTDATAQVYDSVKTLAIGFGLNNVEVEELLSNLGLVPEEVETQYALNVGEANQKLSELRGLLDEMPEEITTLIESYGDDAIKVAVQVHEALEKNIPPERLVHILAKNKTGKEVVAAISDLDSVKQGTPALIQALNKTNPDVVAAQKGVDSVRQNKATKLLAQNETGGAVEAARRSVNSLPSEHIIRVRALLERAKNALPSALAPLFGRKAMGGPVFGPGSSTSDSIPVWLSNSEHVLSAREVAGFGGHSIVEALRAMAREGTLKSMFGFADGGAIGREPISATQFSRSFQLPVVSPSVPIMFPDRMSIEGRLEFDSDGLAKIIDGRIVKYV